MAKTLDQLAHEAVQGLWQRRAFSQRAFAKAMHRPPAVANRMIHGTQPIPLRALDALGALVGINPVELLIDPSLEMKAVNPMEAQALRYFRSWPAATRDAFLTFASYFADESPVTADERRAHEQIRRLPDAKKRVVYAYLTFLTEGFFPEGDLPPDIRKGLGLPETNGQQSSPPVTATRKRPPKKRA